ncbi:MAG: hypothetical protein HUU55_07925, partial [Myxococcales bacterium]|nr:hypothetical protein [Myxococcales bacterium]
MAGAQVPAGGAADSEECKEYIQKTCELAQGNETACAAAKTAAANMTAEQCKLAVSAMAGAQVPTGGAADSEECKEYIQKTCELAQGNETACAAAKTAAANMTAEQCKLAVSAMAGAQVPTGGAADSPECQEYIKKTCELAQGNETACAAAKTAAANMTAEQCKLAVSAMAGAQVPSGGAADSPECQEYIKKTCELAQGNETACAAAKTAAANMTAEQCKLAVSAMAGAQVPTGGAADSPECQEYIKKTCELAQGNETACAAVKNATAGMTPEQCKVATSALAGSTATPTPPAGNAAPECEEYIKKMCERAKGNAIACTAARTATQRMTPDQCKIAASAL